MASKWVHGESTSVFTLSSDENQRKKSLSLSFSVNEPLNLKPKAFNRLQVRTVIGFTEDSVYISHVSVHSVREYDSRCSSL